MRKVRKILILMIIISMISNYFLVLKEFGNAVYASTLELPIVENEENELDDDFAEGASNDLLVLKSKLDSTSRYKGVLLANAMLETKKDFKIQDTLQIEVKSHEQIKSFIIEDENSIISSDESSIDLVNNIEYKSIRIKESEYRNLVDKDGFIVILDDLNDEIARIDKSVESDAGIFDLNFVDGIKNIKILVSGIREDGKINIELSKKLVTTEYTRDQILAFKEIKIKNTVIPVLNEKEEVVEETPIADEIINDEIPDEIVLDSEVDTEEAAVEESTIDNLLVDGTKSDNKVETEVIELKENNFNSSNELILDKEEADLDVSSDVATEEELSSENALTNEHSIALEDTKTKVTLDVDKATLSSSVINDVTLTLTLKNDSEEYDSFKNPVLKVSLPTSVQSAEIASIKILNKNGLALDNWKIEADDEGRLVLNIQLNGIQQQYMSTILNETTIIVGLKMKVDQMNTVEKGYYELIYSNENATILDYDKENKEAEIYEIQYASIKEMLKVVKFDNFNDSEDGVEEFNNSKIVSNLDTNESSRIISASLKVGNNLKSDIKDFEIIGVLPKIGDFDEKGNDYNNTFDMNLNSPIIANGLSNKIYYSDTLDYENPVWREEVTDLASVKMFRIVMDESTIHQSDRIDLDFSMILPGDLAENNRAYGRYMIKYTLNGIEVKDNMLYGFETEKVEIIEEQFENTMPLEVVNGDELLSLAKKPVEEDRVEDVTTEIEIVNPEPTSSTDATTEENDDINIPNVESSETEQDNRENEVINQDSVEDNSPIVEKQDIKAFEVKSIVQKGTEILNDGDTVDEGQLLKFKYAIKNTSGQTLHNVQLKGNANNGNMYFYETYEVISDSNGKMVTTGDWIEDDTREYKEEKMTIESIKPGEIINFEYEVKTNELTSLMDEGNSIFGKLSISADEVKDNLFETNRYTINDADIGVEVFPANHFATNNDYTYTNDTYHIGAYVTNLSSQDIRNATVDIYLDGNLKYYPASSSWYPESVVNVDELTTGQKVSILIPEIKAGESQEVFFVALSDALDYKVKSAEANYYAKVNYNGREYISNEKNRIVTQNETQYDASITSNKVGESLRDGDEIKYTIELENVGAIKKSVNIHDYIDYVMDIIDNKVSIMEDGQWVEQEYTDNFIDEKIYPDYNIRLEPNQKAKIEIIARLDIDKCSYGKEFVDNELKVADVDRGALYNKIEYSDGFWNDEIEDEEMPLEFESVEHIVVNQAAKIEGRKSFLSIKNDIIDSHGLSKTGDKSISGSITIGDDGSIYNKEVEVFLYELGDEQFDINTPSLKLITSDGKFEFTNLPKGKYIVAIKNTTDNSKVETTEENDVTFMNKEIDGTNYAVSDELIIQNNNYGNLEVRMQQINEYDLKINPVLDMISIEKDGEVNDIVFEKDDELKIDLSKKKLKDSEITATFYVSVSNENNMTGYIRRIYAEIPEGWVFDKDLNPDWSLGDNGKVYSEKCKNEVIGKDDVTSREKLVLRKDRSTESGGYEIKFAIDSSSNAYGIKDINEENDEKVIKFEVKKNIKSFLIVIFIILVIIIVGCILILKNESLRNVLINRIHLSIILIVIALSCLNMNEFSIAGVKEEMRKICNGSGDHPTISKENANSWAIGRVYRGPNNVGTYYYCNTDYENCDSYVNNLYGYGSKTDFLYNGGSFRRSVRRAEAWSSPQGRKYIRTMMCFHDTTITIAAYGHSRTSRSYAVNTNLFHGSYGDGTSKKLTGDGDSEHDATLDYGRPAVFSGYMLAVVDFGWNDGCTLDSSPYRYYNRTNGAMMSKLMFGTSGDQTYYTNSHTSAMSQVFAYMAYCCDKHIWYSGGSGSIANMYGYYKQSLAAVAEKYSGAYNSAMATAGLTYNIGSQTVDDYSQTSAVKKNVDAAKSRFESFKDNNGNDTNSIKVENTIGSNEVYPVGTNRAMVKIRIKYPKEGHNDTINNRTFVKYKATDGSWKDVTNFYTDTSARNTVGYDSYYGLTGGNNSDIYMYIPGDLSYTDNNLEYSNSYTLYAGRGILHASGGEQDNMVFRGSRYTKKSSTKLTIRSGGIKINKSVESIDGSTSNRTIAEHDSVIVYKVTLTAMKADLGKIKFEDVFNGSEIAYVSFGTDAAGTNGAGWTKSGNVYSYNNTLGKERSTTLYIKYKVVRYSDKHEIKKVRNTVNVTYVELVAGNFVVYDKSKGRNYLISGSITTSYVDVNIKMFGIKIEKTIHSIDGNTGNTSYAEKGCTIIYRVRILALDNPVKKVKFTEDYKSSEIEFQGISTSAGGTYSNSSGSWSRDNNTIFYNATVNTSTWQTIYFKFEVKCDNSKDSNRSIRNDVNIIYLESGAKDYALYDKNNRVDYVHDTSVLNSNVSFLMKMYKASIDKSIVKLASDDGSIVEYNNNSVPRNKSNQLYGEAGDIVIYCVTLRNTGSGNAYGRIRNIILTDSFNTSELEYLDFGSNMNMNKSGINWSKIEDYKFKYSTELGLGAETKVYLKFRVKKMSKTNDNVTNKISITQVENHHNKTFPIDKMNSASVLTSSDTFKNRIYTVNVAKSIIQIDGDATNHATSEVGDEIEYNINIKNTGTKAGDGVIYTVNVSDIYRDDQLNYVKHVNNSKWTIPSGKNVEGHYVFKNTEHINKDKTISFQPTLLNVYRSKPDNQMINNRASIETDDEVTNRNGVNIRSVLNGTLYSDVKFRYLTYHIDFRHYMNTSATVHSEDSSEVIGGGSGAGNYGRIDLTNKGKYIHPIEHEKNDKDVYYIRLENTGETILYNITFTDEIMSGLEFAGYGSSWNIKSIKLYQKDKPVSTAVDKKSNIQVKKHNKEDVEFLYNSMLKPKEYLLIEINVDITKSNMYLWNLQSEANVPSVRNKHGIEIRKTDETPNDIMNLDVYENKEYIRMKNLMIKGTVWEDKNRDGVMDSDEKGIPNIIVNLIDATNNKKTTVMTNNKGEYIFAETNGVDINTGNESTSKMVESDGRVIKATKRDDTNGNYYSIGRYDEYKTNAEKRLDSKYINYYIEYEYNGARYRASVYSNDDNLDKPGYKINVSNKYLTDSNATEFHDMREEFQNRVGTINYNNTTSVSSNYNNGNAGENSYRLRYNKDGHESTIIDDLSEASGNPVLDMKAYSFVKDENLSGLNGIKASNVNYLWLNKNDGATDNDCYTGETDYLRYINLGLEVQELDLSLEKDVYSVRTTVNGREVVYKYNQGNNGDADKTTEYLGAYATGGKETGGVFTTKNYYFQFYNSDYYYRSTQYENEAVKEYKAITELDTEITYKITIKNNYDVNGFTDATREHLYAVVNEITDYYPVEFIKYDSNNNQKIEKLYNKKETIMEDDLTTYNVPIVEAFYYDDDVNKTGKHVLTLSNETSYPIKYNNQEPSSNELTNARKSFEAEGYHKLYIGGANALGSECTLQDIVLDWNDSKNIYIKYTLDKESNGNLKISNGNSVSEINSYSTFEKYNETINKPSDYAGYIDCNSNPGNMGYNKTKNIFENIFNFKEYENDTYKTGVDMTVLPDNPPPEELNIEENESERAIIGVVWDDARSNEVVSDNGGQAQYTGNGKKDDSKKNNGARKNPIFDEKNEDTNLYSSSYKKYNSAFEEKDSPVKGVKVKLIELVTINSYNPDGTLKDSKIYEETINSCVSSLMLTTTNDNGYFKLKGFIPGQYVVRYEYGYETSNKDIKTRMLVYNGQDYKSTVYNSKLDDVEIDNINADSVDGDKVLKALTGKNRQLNNTDTPDTTTYSDARDDAIMRLRANSYSEYVNNAKSNVLQNTLSSKYKGEKELLNNTNVYAETPIFPVRPEDDTYTKETITYRFADHQKIMKSSKRYSLEGIDFGVEYRPASDVDLEEYIKEIKVSTASGRDIYDLKYDIKYSDEAENSRIVGSELNKKASIGFQEAQAIYNNIDESTKGFIYLNVDADILQGATIEISYVLNANNIGEVDRIAKVLDDMKDTYVAESTIDNEYIYREDTGYEITTTDNSVKHTNQYNATGTAKNLLESEFWITGVNGKIRTNKPRLAKTYYGKYIGSAYYTGNNNKALYVDERDVLVGLKISDIMDYIDNNMVFDFSKNNTSNNYWRTTSSDELASRGMINEHIFKILDKQASLGESIKPLLGKITLTDSNGNRFDDDINSSRLALSMDDKINGSITKYLNPEMYNRNESASIINIKSIKTLSAETDLDNTKYDNSAEIVGYRALNGRVTTLASHSVKSKNYKTNNRLRTITTGNADFSDDRLRDTIVLGIDYSTEPDTAMAEVVSLAPPTGRYKTMYYLMTHMYLIRIVEATIIMMIATPIAIIIIKKVKHHKRVYR